MFFWTFCHDCCEVQIWHLYLGSRMNCYKEYSKVKVSVASQKNFPTNQQFLLKYLLCHDGVLQKQEQGACCQYNQKTFWSYLETVMKMWFWIDLDVNVMLLDWLLVASKFNQFTLSKSQFVKEMKKGSSQTSQGGWQNLQLTSHYPLFPKYSPQNFYGSSGYLLVLLKLVY